MAEWISGIGSLLAVLAALGGYWLIEWHRRQDAQQARQDAAYQIGYKLAALASDAQVTHKLLFPEGKSIEYWLSSTDYMEICGTLQVSIGSTESICRDLNETEQNLLMSLREEDFLMSFSEAFARNSSIDAGLSEYAKRRDHITSLLPPPQQFNGQVGSLALTQQEIQKVMPYLVPCATLVQSMRSLSVQNVKQLSELCEKFKPMMTGHFPKLHIHEVTLKEDA